MLEKLKASARDIVLAALAAGVGAFIPAFKVFTDAGDYSVPAVRAFAVATGVAVFWAAVRAGIGVIAAKLSARAA